MKSSIFFLALLVGFTAHAQSPRKSLRADFQNLGDNDEVVERVRNLDNRQKVRVVQSRVVDRNNRIELSGNFSGLPAIPPEPSLVFRR